MKTIIAPTDFSPASKNAINYAADLACALNTDLTLVHVCLMPLAYTEIPIPAGNLTDMVNDAEKLMTSLSREISAKVSGKIKVNTQVLLGNVIPELKQVCETIKPFAIVMGTEKKGPFERFLTGGNTIAAVRQFSQPVFVIPPGATFRSLKKIGLACDYKGLSETVPIEEIKALVKQFNAELHVLHVGQDRWDDVGVEMVVEAGWLTTVLEEIRPFYDFVTNTDIEEGINQFAKEKEIDLLIVIPKKHGVLNRIFQSSISKQLALNASVPLMSIHE